MTPPGSAMISVPAGPVAIPVPPNVGFGSSISVTWPSGVIRPSLVVLYSVNHITPPAPAAIWYGPAPGVGTLYCVITPAALIRPILSASYSVNHMEPPAPAAMTNGIQGAVREYRI